MGGIVRSYAEGDAVTPLVKEMTQEAINLFEGSAGPLGGRRSSLTKRRPVRPWGRLERLPPGACPSASPWR